MQKSPQLTSQTLKVLSAIFQQAGSSGFDVCKATGLPSGTVYPILSRLEQAGWLHSQWERGDPVTLRRPRRRFYTLTAEGARVGRQASLDLAVTTAVFAS